MDFFTQFFDTASPVQLGVIGASVLLVWFLPAFVALVFNRKHVKLIALACVPAGLSVIAWSGVMVWAFTGNMMNRFNKKARPED
ncbi:superinfection immunity protein [Alteromonas gilva]|uniref:Superinfection immunity protein n=1 Tax=Alteromonas gilva TaxID=2987522 RepID=A0ABT5KXM9_9ALTE|nr:superinfection immunity protein [Alteromonas gilva]MDC8829393.1 superinfection immunity protein [Alteromonas gilva]